MAMIWRASLLGAGLLVLIHAHASALTAYVSNEKSNSVSVIDVDKLSSLDPPSDAKDEQDKLVNDLQHFSGTVNQISDKVQSASAGGVQGLVSLVPQLQSDVQKVSKDAQDLQNAVNNS